MTLIDITVPHGLGFAVVTRAEDNIRVVEHADPTVRVTRQALEQIAMPEGMVAPRRGHEDDPLDIGFELHLDTAAVYRYRPVRVEGDVHVFARIGGPDDPDSPSYNHNRRRR